MAGLCTGISYGLSQSSLNDNKELIFVKLTDSAFRAIEDYQKNKIKFSTHPTIQFSGNEGFMSFPSVASSLGQKFSFSISDIEGPQGSFECLQQSQGQLEILGALPSKLRIHAKEDVYEHTRTKMHEAEEHQKKKSTREIKPNQTDIGRKLKMKHPFSLSNIPNNNVITNKRDLSQPNLSSNLNNNLINNINNNTISTTSATSGTAASNTSVLKSSNTSNIMTGIVNNTVTQQPTMTNINNSSTTTNSCLGLSAVASQNNINSNSNTAPGVNNNTLPLINGCIANNTANPVPKSGISRSLGRGKNNDIRKRSIRERLIHLLAVRPYKKPEVFARITSEGVKDGEKQCVINILKSIAFMRENTYHLHRHIWNDVHEDWPYYTEQEKQSLKRRKPQNLTPPLSSDGGSSTSGQSPTSTHNGSPPPTVKRPVLITEKTLEGPAPKKTRISHCKKETVNHDNNRRGVTDSRDSSNMNPRSRENEEISSSNYFGSNVTPNAHESEDSGMSLSYSVLGSDVVKRIASAPISADPDLDTNEDAMMETQSDNEKISNRSNHDFDQFTRITSIEQRRKYKTEFDSDYAEYRKLYAEIDQTSKRFEQLGKKLRNEKHNQQRYRDIQRQIVSEYNQKMRDSHHQQAKSRFNYLHEKLSYIKRLVNEYDTTLKNKHINQQNY